MVSPTIRKVFVLLSCTFLGLICGTLYLYSSYSPQLAAQLNYSVTDASSIALMGTLGVAVLGPVAGVVVDQKGYTVSMIMGGVCIMTGYLGLKRQFDIQYSNLSLSCILLFLVGSGSTFINSACLKCCAISFPSIRGVATSLPLALYGLSALFYSVIASVFYPGMTSAFLGFLAYSSIGIFCICTPSIMLCDFEHNKKKKIVHARSTSGSFELANLSGTTTPIHSRNSSTNSPAISHNSDSLNHKPKDSQLSGFKLIYSYKFWLIFVITGSLASLGQMYIYSVGYMVKALLSKSMDLEPMDPLFGAEEEIEAMIQRDQQLQVGLLSVANCIGRIASGVAGDIITQSFQKKRSWLLFIPSLGLLSTQIMGLKVAHYNSLSMVSLLTGFFYGFTFCIMPIIVGDIFGMDNFSSNWGVVGLAPIGPSFYFTGLFGRIYDSNSEKIKGTEITSCQLGKGCYDSIFMITLVIAFLAIMVTIALNFGKRSTSKPRKPVDFRKLNS